MVIPQPRRRWALFPGSVLSDFENPPSVLYRAVADQIVQLGDEARFYEERGNPWLRNLLTQDGARGFLEFQQRYPNVDYVTFDPRTGVDLADWINRVLATVDIVVVDPVVSRDIIRWIGELTRPHLHTFLLDPGSRDPEIFRMLQNVSSFSGLCVLEAESTPLLAERGGEQPVIEFGPFSPDDLTNGHAESHVHRTAATLVQEIVEFVDLSLVQQAAEDSE